MEKSLDYSKEWFSPQDLSGIPGVAGDESAVRKAAKKNLWVVRNKLQGKGVEFALSSLPEQTRLYILDKRMEQKMQATQPIIAGVKLAEVPQLIAPASDSLTDQQRQEADARKGVVAAVMTLAARTPCSPAQAAKMLEARAFAGELDEVTDKLLRLALDRRGAAKDVVYPSARTIKRWVGADDLTPKMRKPSMKVPPWARVFLGFYQQPHKPTIKRAYEQAMEVWEGTPFSIDQVKRFIKKVGKVTLGKGRSGPVELKRIMPFVRRDFSELLPNDIWTGDGHTFDAEVQHPIHGRPFRPEITTFLDIATRYCVGWSISLAESSIGVTDALRHGVENCGIPAVLYVDNGSGFKNQMIGNETVGLAARLGMQIEHSIPYNSQARGVIERSHRTLWVDGAKDLPGYIGKHMDREAKLEMYKITRQAIKNGGAMPLMPWDLFLQWVKERVAWYNTRPHRTLGNRTPQQCWDGFVAEGWQPEVIAADEVDLMFRPRELRKLMRAEVSLFNNLYFAPRLYELHGEEIQVGYDIHDPSHVWVYDKAGRFLCQAECSGNSRHYFPVPVVEMAREKRAVGKLSRIDAKRDEALAELKGVAPLPAETAQVVIGGKVLDMAEIKAEKKLQEPVQQPVTRSRSEMNAAEIYAEWLDVGDRLYIGEDVSEKDRIFYERWPDTSAGRAFFKSLKDTKEA